MPLSYRLQSLRSERKAVRARESRDFTVPTAQPSTWATSTSVRPSRSRRITVRALDFLGHDLAQPVELHLVLGPAHVGGTVSGRRHGIEAAHGGIAPLSPVLADERVAEDPEEPGFEIRAGSELRGAAQGAAVRLLHQVFRVGVVAREIAGEVV